MNGYSKTLSALASLGLLTACSSKDDPHGAPVAHAAAFAIEEDGLLVTSLSGSDSEEGELSFIVTQPPFNGSLHVTSSGQVRYQPRADFHGIDRFLFQVGNGSSISEPAAVTIDITPVADAPAVPPHQATVAEDGTLHRTLLATDADGDSLRFTLLTAASHGVLLVDSESGAYTYVPEPDYFGQDMFSFLASDGTQETQGTAALTIVPVNDAPAAAPVNLVIDEDTDAVQQLRATDIDSRALTFRVTASPRLGSVDVNEHGEFRYVPNADVNGEESFAFVAHDGELESAETVVAIRILPVNDAPRINIPSIATNSAAVRDVHIPLSIFDPESDPVTIELTHSDSDVANVRLSQDRSTIIATAKQYGSTEVSLAISDGQTTTDARMQFVATDVERTHTWTVNEPTRRAVRITNRTPDTLRFTTGLGGKLLARSLDEALDEVARESEFPEADEFGGRLLRYVHDNTYHNDPYSPDAWQHDPLALINSLGFGYCDDFAGAFYHLARKHGRESRIWALGGHVVPEILSATGWQMLDPTYSAFYLDDDRNVAGVDQLSANPDLVAHAHSRVDGSDWEAYTADTASLYSSFEDNFLSDFYMQQTAHLSGEIRLPSGAILEFPGKFGAAPRSQNGSNVPEYAQMRVVLPAGWTGRFILPLVLADLRGNGTVMLRNRQYQLGSSELADLLSRNLYHEDVRIITASGPTEIVMLVNPLRARMRGTVEFALVGLDIAGLEAELIELPAEERLP